jgi:tRNA-specific 2-thiouridylase
MSFVHPLITPPQTVVVGMSGGVDSSVTALRLKELGYNVIGLFMKNWEEEIDGTCSTAQDFEDVAQVASHIGIPYYAINFAKEYREQVFTHFLEELKKGHTPNPDILCNREIKFKLLLDACRKLGASALATGHYAQNNYLNDSFALCNSRDTGKDQTYFLYTLNQEILAQVLFPLGTLLKAEVREIARQAKLPVANKKDSTGICFIGKRDFRQFLQQYLAFRPGKFRTLDGKVVGDHHGVAYYTIGQRRGLAIGGPGEAWFVVAKNVEENIVFVEQGDCHPALFADDLIATSASWVSGSPPPLPFHCHAKIRYRQTDQPCVIKKIDGDRVHVSFLVPQRAITIQQSIVFYHNNCCLGGAVIEEVGPSYHEMKKPYNVSGVF